MPGIPTCVYKPDLKKFRVTVPKGKVFYSGGFGVVGPTFAALDTCLSDQKTPQINESSNPHDNECDANRKKIKCMGNGNERERDLLNSEAEKDMRSLSQSSSSVQNLFLFLEEVIYLHERGLLLVLSESDEKEMDLPSLFSLLDEHGISLAVYISYAYLRSQTFVVLRHCDRINETEDHDGEETVFEKQKLKPKSMEEIDSKLPEKKTSINRKKKMTRDKMRERSFRAPPPRILCWDDDSSLWKSNAFDRTDGIKSAYVGALNPGSAQRQLHNIPIAFDVYKPNSNFRRSEPGTPDFYVAIVDFGAPSPPFQTLQDLLKACGNIPLRLASVSDSGTVTMFSIASGDVPIISPPSQKD